MTKDKLMVIPVKAYEAGDKDYPINNLMAYVQTSYYTYEYQCYGDLYIGPTTVPEYAKTSILVANPDLINWLDGAEGVIGHENYDGELDMSDIDAEVRKMIADDYFYDIKTKRDNKEWKGCYESVEFGEIANLTYL